MKKSTRNRFRLLALLTMLVMVFSACNPNTDNGEHKADDTNTELVLGLDNVNDFKIVCPDNYTNKQQELCKLLHDEINKATGVSLEITTDFVKAGTVFEENKHEILVGDTIRAATSKAKENTDKLGDWCIYSDTQKIAIYGETDESLEAAVNEFIKNYITASLEVPSSLLLSHDEQYQINTFEINGVSIKEYSIVSENEKSDAVNIIRTSIQKYVGYTLPIISKSSNPEREILLNITNTNQCAQLSSQINDTQVAYQLIDGTIAFAAGKYCSDLSVAAVSFVDNMIAGASGNISLENTEAIIMDHNNISISTDEYIESLQLKADTFKNKILNNTTDYSSAKYVFYVSPNGSDTNNGLSPEKPWKTLSKANQAPNGSVILLECGSMWRGYFGTRSTLTYSHYGDISKGLPIFNGSRQNYADASLWKATQYENVWECTVKFKNVGIIAFDHDYSVGNYDALVGKTLFNKSDLTLNQKDLDEDLEFFCHTNRSSDYVDTLYIYSVGGNPGERFNSIEIGENVSCIGLHDDVTIDGVRVMYSGGIAVGSGDLKGATVKNCVLEWIGGSKLSEDSTYGNAIQVYGSAIDCTFENNWCYQIYDCGITIQHTSSGDSDVYMRNVSISNNLIEYCYWGIEYWNQKSTSHETSFENIRIDNNFIRFTGYGWGGVKYRYDWYADKYLAEQSSALCCFGLTPNAKDVFIRNNILEIGYFNLVRMDYYGGEDNNHEGNTYVQYLDNYLCRLWGEQYTCGETSSYDLYERLKDKSYKLVIVEKGAYENKLINK